MSYNFSELFLFFGIISLGTIITRALPFLIFPENKKIPKYIKYLSDVLPYTAIGILVVYCLKDVSFTTSPFGLPELISVAAVVILHIVKNNTLISIGIGTILYMILINFVF
ncbi:branched-subunit amino acid transport protein AzlD [Herbinix hemicellulosilytica]|uniref:Putative membrane protein n=1 Tax=Herbinix hemicellulosilytica TaxID=1564487 RepID=A0A0H5SJD7_HERHM|nr:AzlD domain-containing protein [Herbinix hemicellulosilytica]RBP58698.1 branched-subunit amino acid transport protein AzlD [Herbinix hemicellulosilytica]CRZ35622.1 putative membrane protein [Herbinix hemicellulosilytica]